MEWATHQVFNQVPVLGDYNLYLTDPVLQEAVAREGAGWHGAALTAYSMDSPILQDDFVDVPNEPSCNNLSGLLCSPSAAALMNFAPRTPH